MTDAILNYVNNYMDSCTPKEFEQNTIARLWEQKQT